MSEQRAATLPEASRSAADKQSISRGWAGPIRRFIRDKPLGAVGGLIVLLLIVIGVFAPLIAPQSYDDFNVSERLLPPSREHPFGTDEQGRDVFSRVIYGARTSVLIGFGSVMVGLFIATVIGIVSGFYRGLFDMLMQRLVDIWLAFPNLIFIIFIVAIFGRSTVTLIITLGLLISASTSRIIRSVSIGVSQMQYVEAARASGVGDFRLIVRHVLPNVLPIMIISASISIGAVILTESSLSFLGFGPPPPFPSWGRMLQESQTTMTSHPHLALFPGLAITMVVFSFNMFGDALRDVLDPRLRGSR